MAAYGFKGLGWFVAAVAVALVSYLVTSQVAAERGRLESVDASIAKAEEDIRALEMEFRTRASMAQLERWNGEVLRYAAPMPGQLLQGETALASLSPDGRSATEFAQLVPANIPAPSPAMPASAPATATAAAELPGPAARAVKSQAVAMLDEKLLSDSTLGDLMKSARAEASQLR